MRRSPLFRQLSWLSVLPVGAMAVLYAASPQRPGPHTIVLGRIGPYQTALFVANVDGSEERRLLNSTALDYNPAWSPDGQWIAFTSEREGSADLYRVQPDGTRLERLTDSPAYDDQAAFSPDGRQVVFVTTREGGTADLWVLDLRTRKARALTSGPGGDFRPSWSPDGQWVAFSSDRGSTLPREKGAQWWVHLQVADIYLIHPDGSGLKRLSEPGNFCGSPKWTRDSRRVVAYCMSAEETHTYRVPPRPTQGETRLVSLDIASGESARSPPVRASRCSRRFSRQARSRTCGRTPVRLVSFTVMERADLPEPCGLLRGRRTEHASRITRSFPIRHPTGRRRGAAAPHMSLSSRASCRRFIQTVSAWPPQWTPTTPGWC